MPKQTHIQTEADQIAEKKGMTKQEAMFISFAGHLENQFRKYSIARQTKEDEWTRAILQYEGRWDQDDRTKVERAMQYKSTGDLPTINITRPKTNIAIARMWDIQFPVGGDYNFSMAPTPVPKLVQGIKNAQIATDEMQMEAALVGLQANQVPSPEETLVQVQQMADEAAAEMYKEMVDKLVETNYGKEGRRAMEDLGILGCAIIKGPVMTPKVRRMYQPERTADGEEIYTLGSTIDYTAEAYRVDPRLVYPNPSARDPEDLEDIFELHLMNPSKFMDLAENPAFMRSQVAKCLEMGPNANGELPTSFLQTSFAESGIDVENMFLVKEFHGPLPKEVLYEGGLIDEEQLDDPLQRFHGEAWVCNNLLLRLSLTHIEGEYKLPYNIAHWERDSGSVFGHGVPYLLRHPQRIINNAYIMLLDNASLTSGPQIVLNKEMIEPASRDGDYDIAPMKVWFMTEYGADVREAMQFVNVPAQMEGIANIIDMAIQFGDIESSTPQIQQGEIPHGNNTFSGLAQVLSATNINQKRASLNWDDYITRPLMEAWYHHEMQYGTNPAAKGDLKVVIGGATERIDAQIKAQELERALGLAQSSEEFLIHIDPAKAFRQLIKLNRVGDILRPLSEVQAIQQQQAQAAQQAPDPDAMNAEAALLTAQARAADVELRGRESEFKQEIERIRLEQSREKELAEVNARREEVFAELTKSQDQRELKLMELAIERDLTVEELATQLKIAVINNEKDREKMLADLAMFREELSTKYKLGEGI